MARKINKKKVNKAPVVEQKQKVQAPTSRYEKFDCAVNFAPRNQKQKDLVEAIESNDIVFAVGAAGSGKSHVLIGTALKLIQENKFKKLILARPAIEAGEKLGFIPGSSDEKVAPYMASLFDCIDKIIGIQARKSYIQRGIIVVIPMAYLRGRTFDDAVIILDEAQNTTETQFKTFATRMGKTSKILVNGDSSQIDLPYWASSGLQYAIERLQDIDGIDFVYFTEEDVVRHRLVKEIIKRLK